MKRLLPIASMMTMAGLAALTAAPSAFSADAADEPASSPANSISYSLDAGAGPYQEHRLRARLGLNPGFRFLGTAALTSLGGTASSREIGAGLEWSIQDGQRITLQYTQTRGELELLPRNLSLDYAIGFPAFGHDLELTMGYENHAYFGPEGTKLFSQHAFTLSGSVALSQAVDLTLSATRLTDLLLTPRVQQYSRLFNRALARNPDLLPQDLTLGADLGLSLSDSDRLRAGASYSRSVILETKSLTPTLEYEHDFTPAWSAGVNASAGLFPGSPPSVGGGANVTFRF